MHRDVRDVVASMLSLLEPNGMRWIDQHGRRILIDKMRRPSFVNRYALAADYVRDRRFSGHTVGALYWRYKSEAFLDYGELGLPLLGIRYEHFVRHARRDLANALDLLGVEWDDSVLCHPQFEHGELRKGLTIGKTDPRRPIDENSVGRFSDWLGPRELEEIEAIAGSTTEILNRVLPI